MWSASFVEAEEQSLSWKKCFRTDGQTQEKENSETGRKHPWKMKGVGLLLLVTLPLLAMGEQQFEVIQVLKPFFCK